MSDDLHAHQTEPPAIRAWLNQCLPMVFVLRPRSSYAIYLFVGYLVGVMGYLLWNAHWHGMVWQTLDKASAVGTCFFGILVGGVEWIRERSSTRLGIAALVTAFFFLTLLVITRDVRRHLVLLFCFSLVVAIFDLVRYYEGLRRRSPRYKLTSRKLLLFGIDLPLCIGLFMLMTFWLLIEVSGARVSNAAIEAFLTGGLALELALTSAATTLLVAFAKD